MFDLSTLTAKDEFELHLRNPSTDELLYADDEKTQPVKIVLYSTSSKEYRKALNAMQNRQMKRGKKQATAEVMREEGIELLVACSKGSLNLSIHDVPLADPGTFRDLYSDDNLSWVKDQVDTALGDVSNFIAA